MVYARCWEHADLVNRTHVRIRARNIEVPGLVAVAGRNIERVSERLYLRSIDSNVHVFEDEHYFTIDAFAVGSDEDMAALAVMVNSGGLFDLDNMELGDRTLRQQMEAAMPVTQMPLHRQLPMSVRVTNTDETRIVKTVGTSILPHGGTWREFHGVTENEGRMHGVADFSINAIAAFADYEQAESAVNTIKALAYDEIIVKRLYDRHTGIIALAA